MVLRIVGTRLEVLEMDIENLIDEQWCTRELQKLMIEFLYHMDEKFDEFMNSVSKNIDGLREE